MVHGDIDYIIIIIFLKSYRDDGLFVKNNQAKMF